MKTKHVSAARMVKAHEKSVVLGGGKVLYPIPEYAENFASILRTVIGDAELAAYKAGAEDTRQAIRKTLGL